jgi:hypothetical protein
LGLAFDWLETAPFYIDVLMVEKQLPGSSCKMPKPRQK